MHQNKQMSFGLWPSPVTADALSVALRLEDLGWDSEGKLVWLEYRGSHGVLVATEADGNAACDLTEAHNVRARVGYGGGSMTVGHGSVFYVERNGRLYRQQLSQGTAQPLTPAFGRVASPTLSPDGHCMLYVHQDGDDDSLAIVPTDPRAGRWPQRVVYGADFYMDPAWGTDHIAWIEWDHPHMPWETTRLLCAAISKDAAGHTLTDRRQVAGGPNSSISQPRFSADGHHLFYLSDASGWINLYRHDLHSGEQRQLTFQDADLGLPAWVQGIRTYVPSPTNECVYVVENRCGFDRLLRVDLQSGACHPVAGLEDYTTISAPTINASGDRLAAIVSSTRISPRVVAVELDGHTQILRRSTTERLPVDALAEPQDVEWRAGDGTAVHGLLFLPASETHYDEGKPPAIVCIHGGPTAQVRCAYNPRAQFFATRGYAVIEVNYRGSTGYGRQYQQALQGQWGILDVEDAIGARNHLVADGIADSERIVIMGGSAGGYTVLKAMTDHPHTFAAGICIYGVSNLFTLATDTHKFEAHYLDSLIGPLPQCAALYRERSPIFAADRLVDPVAVFQGTEDRVVPPSQSETIVASLRQRNIPHEYHLYEGEEHGFRTPETIRRFYTDVDHFLRQYVLFR